MAAPVNKAKFTQDINAPIKAVYGGGLMFSKDNLSNVISVDIVDGGQPFEVTGTVAGTVIRSDGTTVPVNTGAISGNTVSLTLTEACFDVPGQIVANIIVANGDVKCCVLRAVYTVVPTETSAVVDPGDILPSIADLINDIDAAVASIPADYSGLLASITGTFSASTAYSAGAYVWYDGTLYRFTAAHAAGSWTGSDATAVTIGGELADLKRTITEPTQNIWTFGNQSFVKKTVINNANIPAGTYTISAEVLRESTARVNQNARIIFYKDSIATANVLANPGLLVNSGRQSATFSLSEKANIIVIYSSVNEAQSVDVDALWKNVQLETGTTASDYVPPITGVDYEARDTLKNVAIRADIAQSLTTTAKEQAQTNIGLRNATRNLWAAGDQTFTKQKDIPVDLVPGDYVLSATVVSVKNNEEANNYNARIEITTVSDGTLVFSIDRNYRAAILFNLPSAATNIRLYASNTGSNSNDTTSTWTNIQLEKNTFQTPYIAPYMPYDEKIIPDDDVLLSAENLTVTLSQWRFATIRKNIDLRNVIIECDAKWTGNEADEYHVPEARFFYSTGDQGTGYYNVGEKGFYKNSQWRLPPFPNYTGEYKNRLELEFRIPTGLTLYIRKLVVRYDDSQTRFGAGLMIHTHGSFMFYPQHSLPALWAAAKCGATHFVTIPKRAEVLENGGGEWFCYHDDAFVESTTILRTSDGQQITNSGYNNKPFSEIPWSWLKTLDSGVYKNSQFAGTRLMLVEEMLAVCAKVGMHPVFSWHPWSSQTDVQNFRELLEKYDMVGKTTILPSNPFFTESAYPVFGNDLEMYKFGLTMGNATTQTVQGIIDLVNGTSGLDKKICCIALWITDATDELVDMIRNAGIKVGLHQYSHTSQSGRTDEAFSGGDYLYWMKRGVTVFTDNHNSSIGLNW